MFDRRPMLRRALRGVPLIAAYAVSLALASRVTLPFNGAALPAHPLLAALRAMAGFTPAGACLAVLYSRAGLRIDIAAAGCAAFGFALATSLSLMHFAPAHLAQCIVGALLSADGAAAGAWFAHANLPDGRLDEPALTSFNDARVGRTRNSVDLTLHRYGRCGPRPYLKDS